MFDIDSGKLLIVAVLALIVIGPKELPRVLRQVGQSVGKLRRMAGEFQGQFMDAMKEADIADIRKELDEINKSAALDVHFDPVRDIRTEMTGALDEPVMSTNAPTAGFELPKSLEDEAEPGGAAAGIAPVAEAETIEPITENAPFAEDAPSTSPELTDLNGSAPPLIADRLKRRIAVKRRTSRVNVVQPEAVAQRTGEPLLVRRRTVRMKSRAPESVLPA